MDGSQVCFVAKGRLTREPKAPTISTCTSAMHSPSDGRIGFVAALLAGGLDGAGSEGDADVWGKRHGGNGGKPAYALPLYSGLGAGMAAETGTCVFASEAPLLPAEDQDAVDDVYRYDDGTRQLQCLTCLKDGPLPVELRGQDVGDEADEIQTYRIASEDGGSVFSPASNS